MKNDQDLYEELSYYTLAHNDPSFIHQHIVDAFAAQTADQNTKSIKLTFALVGLYLYVERQFSGRQVQRFHMQLAQEKQSWPVFSLPAERGEITVAGVLGAPAGPERDKMIHQWCISVWDAFSENRPVVQDLLGRHKIG
ncbi:MAG TPA: DUF5946 family protein [Anaerolineales bacterium]|nr:DUF5946 family protein [Anaerolineales bacterium]